ncbi:hypothetical protein DICSQDRAFT_157273 [Dichomitus squalens LYAD-421 SS1]|uniref:Uncharacterized protein n=1 Tax=Dichomitus squalens (strain LYAD-421) TaxID=732165 RepID=R7SRG4_DICSQ|nr:uncharacterized protein DICSQDRAFT_157273 [Dichomitus squalens LYAD-421 SS1]EJF57562.1 hypothetical protein DICSQDRAFT_157273 [Dichomitus squalens LYAD-421 SS1]
MATPFSTPRYPGAPNPTPRSTGKPLRPPIHNPYDKFTQPQFDAWINDITGALKRALGRDDGQPVPLHAADRTAAEDDAEGVDDSFAEVRARRLAKGKQRARDEDLVDNGAPEEHYGDESGWGETYSGQDYSSEDEEGEEESEEDEEEEAPDKPDAEVIELLSDDEDASGEERDGEEEDGETVAGPAPAYDEEEDEGGFDEGIVEDEVAADVDEIVEEEEDAAEEDLEDEEDAYKAQCDEDEDDAHENIHSSPAHEVTEVLDSDEEEAESEPFAQGPVMPARFLRKPDVLTGVHVELDEDQLGEAAEEEQNEEEAEPFPPRTAEREEIDIQDPWQGPSIYAEDFYSNGDMPSDAIEHGGNPHLLPTEEEPNELVADIALTPEIRDPWEGPRTYAEDLYAGGDVLPNPADGVTPSHLTPRDDGEVYIPGISSVRPSAPRSPGQQQDVVDLDAEQCAPSPQVALVTERVQDETEPESTAQDAQEPVDETPRSPSPPSLNKHVNWNWPPAFPGRVASGAGHLTEVDDGIVEISDDEDEDDMAPPDASQAEPNVREAISAEQIPFGSASDGPGSPSMPFSLGFEELYDMDAGAASYSAFEPVASAADFGDLPPSREERHEGDTLGEEAPPGSLNSTTGVTGTEEHVLASEERPASAPGQPFVEEVEDMEGSLPKRSATEELDVVSLPGDDIDVSTRDYLIEEVSTEGRRTEEPEAAVDAADDAAAAAPTLSLNTEGATVGGEYPAPVSADPTVPDPTSVSHTPASPVDSIASSSYDKELVDSKPVYAALLPVIRKGTSAHSASGLFTPMTDGPSGSVTPEHLESGLPHAEAQIAEEHAEAPAEPDVVPSVVEGPETPADEEPSVPGLEGSAAQESVSQGMCTDEGDDSSALIFEPQEAVTAAPAHEDRRTSPAFDAGADADADADPEGELDLEYDPSEGAEESSVAVAEEIIPAAPKTEEDDPFVVKEDAEVPLAEDAERDDKATSVYNENAVKEAAVRQAAEKGAPDASNTTEADQRDEGRPLKRKRKSPPAGPVRITRSKTSVSGLGRSQLVALEISPKSRKGKGKGKQRASRETDDEEDAASVAQSLISEEGSVASSIAAQNLLHEDGSRESSRASSVVSNGLSMYSEASPTVGRTLPNNGNRLVSLPFIHDNGVLRHNHGGRAPVPVLPPPPPKRQLSLPPAPSSRDSVASSRNGVASSRDSVASSREGSAKPSPPATQPPISRPSFTPSTSTHSPATRSNCRYHTISLPREEDDERHVFFAVPGCSLSNAELMEEENIRDHGLTRTDELPSKITPIEDLKISPELMATLRQLTGVDLFREQEVIYLPRPGDNIVPKKRRLRTKLIQRESISARTLPSKELYSAKQTTHKAPLSQMSASTSGGSASVAAKLSERGSASTSGGSFSGSDLSDLEDEDERPTKRSKASPPDPDPDAGEVAQPGVEEAELMANGESSKEPHENGKADDSASVTRRRRQSRRARKLKVDALAFKPEEGQSDGSDEEEGADTLKKRRRVKKRGVKRTRTEENGETQVDGAVPERPKRRRRGEQAAMEAEAPQS